MNRFQIAPLALADLEAIWNYVGIENDGADAAHRLLESIYEKFALLAAQPLMGELREDLADLVPGIRSFSVGNYVVYYQVARGCVKIGRGLHGARDTRTLFGG